MSILLSLVLSPAHACGGFFCNNVQPVEQTGERILFRQERPDEWTTFVEVQYQGPPSDFAWVIPLERVIDPETEVQTASPGLFDALEEATAPRFVEELAPAADSAGYAEQSMAGCSCGAVDGGGYFTGDVILPDTSGVEVVGDAVVGPYDLEVITAEEGDNLVNWLQQEGYQFPLTAEEPLQHYVDGGYAFLGVKLRADVPRGPIDTLVLRCGASEPLIPLRLTAIAASPGMEVLTYVLGEHRYRPDGLPEHEPDYGAVRFLGDGTTDYTSLLRASFEAQPGLGFVTEYAAPAEQLLSVLDSEVAAELGGGAYLTRLRSFADPDQMVVDPVFVPDPEASDVPNVHVLSGPQGAAAGSAAALAGLMVGLGVAVRRRSGSVEPTTQRWR